MNTKKLFLLFVLLTFCMASGFPQAKNSIKKIVIDAGHGGHDPGALGCKSKEKDIALAVALEVGKKIKNACPDVEVYYTRSTDVFVKLENRCKFANDKHADLFISIHCNASENKNARGTEVYVMGLHKSEASLAVAKRENASMLLESDYQSTYGNFDPNSPESYVIFSLYSNAYLDHSVKLAAKVQKNLVKTLHFPDRKVQQAGYWVLHGVAMPSILIEMAFISNATEEAALMDKETQKKIAGSICDAFVEYKKEIETGKTSSDSEEKEDEKPTEDENSDNASNNSQTTENQTSSSSASANNTSTNSTHKQEIHFKVQICALPDNLPTTDKRFAGLPKVSKYQENNLWKYTVGDEASYDDIQKVLTTAKAKFPDAFVIAFKNGKKIPVSEARKSAQ